MNLTAEQLGALKKIVEVYKKGSNSPFLFSRTSGSTTLVYPGRQPNIPINADETDLLQLASLGLITLDQNTQGLPRGKPTKLGVQMIDRNVEGLETSETTSRISVFVSHKESDRPIANRLVSLLLSSLQIDESEVRCTSVAGHKLPFGQEVAMRIKKDLLDSSALLALLTHDSVRSSWVLFELGAAWALDKVLVPILGPDLGIEDLPGPLPNLRAIRIQSDDAAREIRDAIKEIGKALKVKERTGGKPQAQLEDFIKKFRQSGKANRLQLEPEIGGDQTTGTSPKRELTYKQYDYLLSKLKRYKDRSVHVTWLDENKLPKVEGEECHAYAQDFFLLFVEAGWKVTGSSYGGDLLRHFPIIRIWAKDKRAANRFGAIFEKCNLLVRRDTKPNIAYDFELLIGPRQEVNLMNLKLERKRK